MRVTLARLYKSMRTDELLVLWGALRNDERQGRRERDARLASSCRRRREAVEAVLRKRRVRKTQFEARLLAIVEER